MAVRFVQDFNQAVLDDFVSRHQRSGGDQATPLLEAIDRMVSNLSEGDLAELRERHGPRALLGAAERLAAHTGGAFAEDAPVLEADVVRAALDAGAELLHTRKQLREAIDGGDMAALDRREILHQAAFPSRIEEGEGIDPTAMPSNTSLSRVRDFKVSAPAADQQQDEAGADGTPPSLARR